VKRRLHLIDFTLILHLRYFTVSHDLIRSKCRISFHPNHYTAVWY